MDWDGEKLPPPSVLAVPAATHRRRYVQRKGIKDGFDNARAKDGKEN